jgi:hypothetical protein
MIHNAKVLSLAVVVAFALTAVVASAASAASFHAEKSPVTITGSRAAAHPIKTDPGTIDCNTVTFHGERTAITTTQQTMTATYSNCTLATIFGNIAVTVNFNGCHYLFTANREVHTNCPAGANVVISGPGCTVTIPPQTIEHGVEYTNQGAGTTRDNTVHWTIHNNGGNRTDGTPGLNNGLDYSYSGFTCGSGSGTTNGTITGPITWTGSNTEGHIGIWWTA